MLDSSRSAQVKTVEEVEREIANLTTVHDPNIALRDAKELLKKPKAYEDGDIEDDEEEFTYESPTFRAMTLSEFKNGILMINSISEQYRTFAIDMLRQILEEYGCTMVSEKATAELVVISYVRTLDIQSRLRASLDRPEKHEVNMVYINILSKELDRANRHYLASLQTLRMLNQPSLSVTVKTNTAIIGQNQLIQENQNVNPI